MATYKYNPPSKVDLSKIKSPSLSNNKNRIYQLFKPTLTLDELSLPSDQKEFKDHTSDNTMALSFPIIKINDYFFAKEEIDNLEINCTGFLPRLTLTVTTTNDLFLSKEFPKDGDFISIAIRSKSDLINIVRNDYVITGVPNQMISTLYKGPKTFTFFAELFIPGLKSSANTFSVNGTSMDFFISIAKYLQLGFCSNENDTDDKQVWMSYQDPFNVVKETITRVWKDKDSFFESWIDIYYNLNLVNVNKQLLSAEDDVDLSAAMSNIDSEWNWGSNTEQTNTSSTPKVFSNIKGYRNTSFYITNWKPNNKSTAITFDYGTTLTTSLYEHNDGLYRNNLQKDWVLEIQPNYDKDKLTKYILLRGRSNWNKDTNKGELARANYNYQDLYKRAIWMGIQYTVTNANEDHSKWDGNHHKNYLRAYPHNMINLAELEKLNLEIAVQGTNLNVIKGDKLPVILIKNDLVENTLVLKDSFNEALDFFYSGWYLVKGFTLNYSGDSNNDVGLNNFSQTFILTRREWPTPLPIEPISLTENPFKVNS